MKSRRSLLGPVAILLVIAILAPLGFPPFAFLPLARAQSSSSGLEMNATPAFGGHFKYGEWLPLWVQLENHGPDLQVEVRVSISDSWGGTGFAVPLELPAGSRKRQPLYVLPNNFSRELEVQVVGSQGILATQKVTVRPHPNINYLVGLLAPSPGALSLIKGISLPGSPRNVVLVDLALAELPERPEALRSFDALVINDVDTSSFTPGQKSALETWVLQGGRLVIGGGAGAQRSLDGLPGELRIFKSSGLREAVQVDQISGFVGDNPVRVPGPFVVATGQALEAHILIDQDGLPLLVERPLGKGFVDFAALDLAVSPFDAWAGTTLFWETLLSPGASYPDWMPFDMSFRQRRAGSMTYALSNLPALDLPSVRSLAVLLTVYVLLVGPLNYLFLRWRKRLHLAWITIPLITLAFSGGAFGLGYLLRGTDLILNKIAIVETGQDANASVSSYIGLFSPAQRSYELEVAGDSLLSPLRPDYDPWGGPANFAAVGEAVFVQGQPARIRDLTVNQWSMQSFVAESTWIGFGRIHSDLRLDGQALVGHLHNDTAFTFTDTVLVLGGQFLRLGDLAPGQSRTVHWELPSLVNHPYESSFVYQIFSDQFNSPMGEAASRQVQLKQSVLESIFPLGNSNGPIFGASAPIMDVTASYQVLLFGWFEQAPPDVTISGRQPAKQVTSLLFAPLSFSFSQGDRLSLVPGLLPGRVLELPREGGYCGSPGTPAVYLGRGEAVFEFHLPPLARDVAVDTLILFIGTDWQWNNPPAAALYDWSAERWSYLSQPEMGPNWIQPVDGMISADGLVRVRLAPNTSADGCFFLAMGLEGDRK